MFCVIFDAFILHHFEDVFSLRAKYSRNVKLVTIIYHKLRLNVEMNFPHFFPNVYLPQYTFTLH